MKALNNKEINKKYAIFLLNFTLLLTCTVACYFLYLKAGQQQSRMIVERKQKYDFIFNKRQQLANTIDTLNFYLAKFNTHQVTNEEESERTILRMKNEANTELEVLKKDGDSEYYQLFEKIIGNVEMVIDNKHALGKALEEEKIQTEAYDNCVELNNKAAQELAKGNI